MILQERSGSGCMPNLNASHGAHTYVDGECRVATTPSRTGLPRRGRHPRAPSRVATDSPTTGARPQLQDGTDFGAPPTPPRPIGAHDDGGAPHDDGAPQQPSSSSSSAYAPLEQHGRGPRTTTSTADASTTTPTAPDWTRFDITTSMRALRSGTPAQIERELRKLHLRWWHASTTEMTNILRAAGIATTTLERIPGIVATCKECRVWQPPDPQTQTSFRVSVKFNEHVECDLLFYHRRIILHLICRATRWHVAGEVADKTENTLWEGVNSLWLTTHGPMNSFIVDGEKGMTSEEFHNRLKARGIKLEIRAVQQHARYIERRGAILRLALHHLETQVENDGLLDVSFKPSTRCLQTPSLPETH